MAKAGIRGVLARIHVTCRGHVNGVALRGRRRGVQRGAGGQREPGRDSERTKEGETWTTATSGIVRGGRISKYEPAWKGK